MPKDSYEASLTDDTLESLVGECLKLLEHRFAEFDTDGAKYVSFLFSFRYQCKVTRLLSGPSHLTSLHEAYPWGISQGSTK